MKSNKPSVLGAVRALMKQYPRVYAKRPTAYAHRKELQYSVAEYLGWNVKKVKYDTVCRQQRLVWSERR